MSPSLSCSVVFFSTLTRSRYLSFFSISINLIQWSTGSVKSAIQLGLCFLLTEKLKSSGQVWVIRLNIIIPEEFYVSFSRTDSKLCIYHLFVRSNFNFLHISQWITYPTQSYLVLCSFALICFICILCD